MLSSPATGARLAGGISNLALLPARVVVHMAAMNFPPDPRCTRHGFSPVKSYSCIFTNAPMQSPEHNALYT